MDFIISKGLTYIGYRQTVYPKIDEEVTGKIGTLYTGTGMWLRGAPGPYAYTVKTAPVGTKLDKHDGFNDDASTCYYQIIAKNAMDGGTMYITATAADVGIAIGLKKGNALRDQINTVLAEITEEQRSQLMEQIVTLASGGTVTEFAVHCDAPATTTGTLKIGMECAYEPYNWTDTDGSSFGAVPISSEGQQGLYANGYDVQIAQYVANRLGLKLEIYAMEWDSLIPAVNSGAIDAIVAGMSPTAERAQEVDFTDTYYESNLVVIIRK